MDARDELIERAAAVLRRDRPRNARVVSRILGAVDGRSRRWWRAATWPSAPFSLAATLSLAAAGLILGFVTRDAAVRRDRGVPLAAQEEAPVRAQALRMMPASRGASEATTTPVQFTLRDVRAARVALVGDFNGWSQTATLLEPGTKAGTWSVTVPLSAGRHVYAFVVDGQAWMTDPRSPKARDLDFGRANSVLIVQAP